MPSYLIISGVEKSGSTVAKLITSIPSIFFFLALSAITRVAEEKYSVHVCKIIVSKSFLYYIFRLLICGYLFRQFRVGAILSTLHISVTMIRGSILYRPATSPYHKTRNENRHANISEVLSRSHKLYAQSSDRQDPAMHINPLTIPNRINAAMRYSVGVFPALAGPFGQVSTVSAPASIAAIVQAVARPILSCA